MRTADTAFARVDDVERHDLRAYRAGRWFAAALFGDAKAADYCEKTKGLALVRAAKENPNSAGGFLVPNEIESAIITQRAVAGTFRQEGDVRTMGSDVRTLPRRASGVSVNFIPEGVAAAETQGAFADVTLSTRKAGALIRISSELYEDEAVDLGNFLTEDFGNALAALEDSCGFNGDGTSTYNGMSGITKILIDGAHNAGKVAAATGHDTFAEIDSTDLGNLIAALPEQYFGNAKWYASAYAIGTVFARLGMSTGGMVQTANGPRPQFYYGGFPIVPTPRLPAVGTALAGSVMIGFGDLRQSSTLGARRGLTIRRSEHPFFAEDQIALLGTERFDLVNHTLGDNTTAGAFVGLVGTA